MLLLFAAMHTLARVLWCGTKYPTSGNYPFPVSSSSWHAGGSGAELKEPRHFSRQPEHLPGEQSLCVCQCMLTVNAFLWTFFFVPALQICSAGHILTCQACGQACGLWHLKEVCGVSDHTYLHIWIWPVWADSGHHRQDRNL